MGLIENIIKEAEQQVLQPDSQPAPVVSGTVINKDDVEKVANVLDKVGNLYKLGQDPDVALVPPVSGEQAPAEGEAKKVKAVTGSVGEAAQVSLVTPVAGEQQEAAPDPKVAEWKQRMRKVATEMLMQSDKTQEPGNVGLTAPAPDQTGFPDDAQKLTAVSTGQIEESNTVKPMTPLLNEPPKTSDEEMAAALPQATKSPATTAATAGGESKTAALSKEAEDEVMGRISAHAFMDELTGIYGMGKEAVDLSDVALVAVPAAAGAGIGAGVGALKGGKGHRGGAALKGALIGGGVGAAGGGAALAGRHYLKGKAGEAVRKYYAQNPSGPQSSYTAELLKDLAVK